MQSESLSTEQWCHTNTSMNEGANTDWFSELNNGVSQHANMSVAETTCTGPLASGRLLLVVVGCVVSFFGSRTIIVRLVGDRITPVPGVADSSVYRVVPLYYSILQRTTCFIDASPFHQ